MLCHQFKSKQTTMTKHDDEDRSKTFIINMMRRPSVTPIFPKNNDSNIPQHNLPIRKTDSAKHILNSGGFNSHGFDPTPYSINAHSHFIAPPQMHQHITCIDVARHIDACPICSRLYDTDKTLYILAIIGLLILCFLMVKRIIKI